MAGRAQTLHRHLPSLPPPPVIPQKRSNQGETANSPPETHARQTGVTGLTKALSFLPPNNTAFAAPTAPTTYTPLSLKNPWPNIHTAISSDALIQALHPVHRLFLDILERDGVLVSIPNPQGSGSHSPFFIVELEASATGGTLYQRQNQATVSGASAVGILREVAEREALVVSVEEWGSGVGEDRCVEQLAASGKYA